MKLSVFFDHILQAMEQTGKPMQELLASVRESGIEAVEIRLEYLEEHGEVLEQLKQTDLDVSCIYEFYEMGLGSETEKCRRHIEAAERVGAKRVLVVPGFFHGLEAWSMGRKMNRPQSLAKWMARNRKIAGMVQGLNFISKLGAEKGVVVTVEDFDDVHSPLSGMHGIHWFLEQIPELRYTLDTGNYLFYDENVLDAWELLKDKVAHVHCKDRHMDNNASVPTGSGRIPIRELVEALKERGYDGYLAIEHFDVEEQEECMFRSAEFLRKIL